jgi:hypothetical protein
MQRPSNIDPARTSAVAEPKRGGPAAVAPLWQTAILCVGAALLSLLFTGWVFGVDNNVFHLPILHRLYDADQFRGDAFVQSLRHYSSGIWLLLAGRADDLGDGRLLFLVLLYVSRLIAFVGLVACGSLLGVRSLRDRVIFCLILCFGALLDGTSLAGHGGLFSSAFGQSEMANGVMLVAIALAIRGRIALAGVAAGVVFFINAFMGVWILAPLAAIAGLLLWQRKIGIAGLSVQALAGGAGYALLAFPIVWNVLGNPDFGKPAAFDYARYLRDYFGAHFFIGSNPIGEIGLLVAAVVVGWLAITRLQRHSLEFHAALAAAVGVYLVGIIVAVLTSSPAALNLHLLRSSVMIHLLAATAAAALATRWLTSEDGQEATVLGPYLLLSLCSKYALPAAAALIGFESIIRSRLKPVRDDRLRAVIIAAVIVVILPWQAWQHFKRNAQLAEAVQEWEAVGSWAKLATAPESVFLIPITADAAPADGVNQRAEASIEGSRVFEAMARRRVWIDFKSGAAVMWQPSYYDEWWSRTRAVAPLRTLEQKTAYARRVDISYIVDDCLKFVAKGRPWTFRTSRLCVAAVE